MNEQLEWVKDNMPEGWGLVIGLDGEYMPTGEYRMYENNGDFATTVYESEGDIGLAPLTALLKQELDGVQTTGPDEGRWLCGLRDQIVAFGGDTEFEAVLAAYRETR